MIISLLSLLLSLSLYLPTVKFLNDGLGKLTSLARALNMAIVSQGLHLLVEDDVIAETEADSFLFSASEHI